MYVIAIADIQEGLGQPRLEKNKIYKVLKIDKLHFFVKAKNNYGMFGFYKEKFKILEGNPKAIELLYLKGNNDSI